MNREDAKPGMKLRDTAGQNYTVTEKGIIWHENNDTLYLFDGSEMILWERLEIVWEKKKLKLVDKGTHYALEMT